MEKNGKSHEKKTVEINHRELIQWLLSNINLYFMLKYWDKIGTSTSSILQLSQNTLDPAVVVHVSLYYVQN